MTLVITNTEPENTEPAELTRAEEIALTGTVTILNAVDALIESANCLVHKFAPDDVIPEWRIEDLRARADAVFAAYDVSKKLRMVILGEEPDELDADNAIVPQDASRE
jgi:hypothetical protein